MTATRQLAAAIIRDLGQSGHTLATAESVTGGGVVAELTNVPGASAVVRGAVVAYATDVKTRLLDVAPDLLNVQGPVSLEVVAEMAQGARRTLGASFGVATTGEAGPTSASGSPVGTVLVAVAGPRRTSTRALPRVAGDRAMVRQAAVAGALALVQEEWRHTVAPGTTGD